MDYKFKFTIFSKYPHILSTPSSFNLFRINFILRTFLPFKFYTTCKAIISPNYAFVKSAAYILSVKIPSNTLSYFYGIFIFCFFNLI